MKVEKMKCSNCGHETEALCPECGYKHFNENPTPIFDFEILEQIVNGRLEAECLINIASFFQWEITPQDSDGYKVLDGVIKRLTEKYVKTKELEAKVS